VTDNVDSIPHLIRQLYTVVSELERLFPGRKFTPDGHLVGSIGEVFAAHYYGLELLPASAPTHDATSSDGILVQIKATQGKTVGLRAEPDHLLVLGLFRDGSFEEIYNGPGDLVWEAAGKLQKNGQRPIGVSKLRGLMDSVASSSQVPRQEA
jgi:hypothetical protein